MYLHMNTLLYGTTPPLLLTRNNSSSILKSSGYNTPAPTSKVLRWKDLEATSRATINEPGLAQSSVQSVFGTEEGEKDLLTMDEIWENEEEELFV